jgi:hypothetical protein
VERYALEMILGDTRTDWGELKAEMTGIATTLPILMPLTTPLPSPPLIWNPTQAPTTTDPSVIYVDKNQTVPFTAEDRKNLINQTFPNRLDTSIPLQPLTTPPPRPPLVSNPPTNNVPYFIAIQAERIKQEQERLARLKNRYDANGNIIQNIQGGNR